jgi:hypothetical protein
MNTNLDAISKLLAILNNDILGDHFFEIFKCITKK